MLTTTKWLLYFRAIVTTVSTPTHLALTLSWSPVVGAVAPEVGPLSPLQSPRQTSG